MYPDPLPSTGLNCQEKACLGRRVFQSWKHFVQQVTRVLNKLQTSDYKMGL